ncbi:hypothetical protein [Arthrobacter sp. HLT1-21]
MAAEKNAAHIEFTIDGQTFTVAEKHQTAAALLGLAGLPARGYDLAEVRGHGDVHTFKDEKQVVLKTGDEFVTVRQSAQVA